MIRSPAAVERKTDSRTRHDAALPSDVRWWLRPTVTGLYLPGLRPKGIAQTKEAADGRAKPFRTSDGKPFFYTNSVTPTI